MYRHRSGLVKELKTTITSRRMQTTKAAQGLAAARASRNRPHPPTANMFATTASFGGAFWAKTCAGPTMRTIKLNKQQNERMTPFKNNNNYQSHLIVKKNP